jgi:hypothetical protein
MSEKIPSFSDKIPALKDARSETSNSYLLGNLSDGCAAEYFFQLSQGPESRRLTEAGCRRAIRLTHLHQSLLLSKLWPVGGFPLLLDEYTVHEWLLANILSKSCRIWEKYKP